MYSQCLCVNVILLKEYIGPLVLYVTNDLIIPQNESGPNMYRVETSRIILIQSGTRALHAPNI